MMRSSWLKGTPIFFLWEKQGILAENSSEHSTFLTYGASFLHSSPKPLRWSTIHQGESTPHWSTIVNSQLSYHQLNHSISYKMIYKSHESHDIHHFSCFKSGQPSPFSQCFPGFSTQPRRWLPVLHRWPYPSDVRSVKQRHKVRCGSWSSPKVPKNSLWLWVRVCYWKYDIHSLRTGKWLT